MNKVKKWVVCLFSCLLCLLLAESLWAGIKVEKIAKARVALTKFAIIALDTIPVDSSECDLMVMLNGTEIECRIMEINKNKIVYKLCDTTKTKMFSINKRDIVYVERTNGEELYTPDLAAIGAEKIVEGKKREIVLEDDEESEINIFSFVSPVSALLASILLVIGLVIGLSFSGAGLLSFIFALIAFILGGVGFFVAKKDSSKPNNKFWTALGLGIGSAILITLGILFLK